MQNRSTGFWRACDSAAIHDVCVIQGSLRVSTELDWLLLFRALWHVKVTYLFRGGGAFLAGIVAGGQLHLNICF